MMMKEVNESAYQESLELLKKLADGTNVSSLDEEKYRNDLKRLLTMSEKLYNDIESTVLKQNPVRNRRQTLFSLEYQHWYSEASEFIRNALPSRLEEFEFLYRGDRKNRTVDARTYCINDWLLNIMPYRRQAETKRCNDIVLDKFRMQIQILRSAGVRFESSLLDIERIMRQANLEPGKDPSKETIRTIQLELVKAMANVYQDIAISAFRSGHEEDTEENDPGS